MTTRRLVVRFVKILGTIILLAIVILVGWWALYPGPDDPKGFMYIGWRLGLPTIDQDRALGTMVGDVHRETLVIGKTKAELIKKFGYVTPISQTDDGYYGFCYRSSGRPSQPALMLRNSNWMVLMKDGRAIDLVLLKGC
jgi:hypothetical protein